MNKLIIFFFLFITYSCVDNKDDAKFVRLVKIKIDKSRVEEYIPILKKQMRTSILREDGVLDYHVVNEKENPSNFTLIEIYKDTISYEKKRKDYNFTYSTTI